MDFTIVMRPNSTPREWPEFCNTAPPFSIALDGYVIGPPQYDPTGPRANFNHHEGVDRLGTRATCAQVLFAIRQGLFKSFAVRNRPRVIAHANDCDEDVCLSMFLLSHPHLCAHTVTPLLNRLVFAADALDTTAGAYPFPSDLPLLEEMAWVFEPYRRFRTSGQLDRRDADAFEAVVTDVSLRIGQHIVGNGQKLNLDIAYKIMERGEGWTMIDAIGTEARTGMFSDGIQAYVLARQRPDGRYTYVVARTSIFITYFDVPQILNDLNLAEGNPADPWGGGNTIGGSGRKSGSRLSPTEVSKIVGERVRTTRAALTAIALT